MSHNNIDDSNGESMKERLLFDESIDSSTLSASSSSVIAIASNSSSSSQAFSTSPRPSTSSRSQASRSSPGNSILKTKSRPIESLSTSTTTDSNDNDANDSTPLSSSSRSVSFSNSSRSRGVSFAPAVSVHVFHYSQFNEKTKEYSQYDPHEDDNNNNNNDRNNTSSNIDPASPPLLRHQSSSGSSNNNNNRNNHSISPSNSFSSNNNNNSPYSYKQSRDFEFSHPLIESNSSDIKSLCKSYWCTKNIIRIFPSLLILICFIMNLITVGSNGWGNGELIIPPSATSNGYITSISVQLGIWESCSTLSQGISSHHNCIKFSIGELSTCSNGPDQIQAEYCRFTIITRIFTLLSTFLFIPTLITSISSLLLFHRCYTIHPKIKLRCFYFTLISIGFISLLQFISFFIGLRVYSSLWDSDLYKFIFPELSSTIQMNGFNIDLIQYSSGYCIILLFIIGLFSLFSCILQYYVTTIFRSRVKSINSEQQFSEYNYYNIYDWGKSSSSSSSSNNMNNNNNRNNININNNNNNSLLSSNRPEDIALERLNININNQPSDEFDNDGL